MKTQPYNQLSAQIKTCMWVIIIGLALSGLTAFPIEAELSWLVRHSSAFSAGMRQWLVSVALAVKDTNSHYPFLSYGTDWLAFAHLMLALLFVGPLKDPVKNIWVIQFGMWACVCIFPLAFIAGGIRGIPVFWQFIDCSFGAICIIPLYLVYRNVKRITASTSTLNNI